jgi:hypothetical protein
MIVPARHDVPGQNLMYLDLTRVVPERYRAMNDILGRDHADDLVTIDDRQCIYVALSHPLGRNLYRLVQMRAFDVSNHDIANPDGRS